MIADSAMSFLGKRLSVDKYEIRITIAPSYVESLYQYIIKKKKGEHVARGFFRGTVPAAYLDSSFKLNVLNNLGRLFLNHCVFNFLYKKLIEKRIVVSGEPVTKDVIVDLSFGAVYVFEVRQNIPPIKSTWKKLSFKLPSRRKYRDLDKQVESFFEEEKKSESLSDSGVCDKGDWILLGLSIIDEEFKPLLPGHTNLVWIKLGEEQVNRTLYELIESRCLGEEFFFDGDFLQEYLDNNLDLRYRFNVKILDRVPHRFFSLGYFKKYFRLRGGKDMHEKMIEVFSNRNDISLRREILDKIFGVFFKSFPFVVSKDLITREKLRILTILQKSQDYSVYKVREDFDIKLMKMAEIRVKEFVVVNYLACKDGVGFSSEEVSAYLNLTNRPRTKNFIHFGVPMFKDKLQEVPIPLELLRYYCLHEKVLNKVVRNFSNRASY